jgi:hypothetical protein
MNAVSFFRVSAAAAVERVLRGAVAAGGWLGLAVTAARERLPPCGAGGPPPEAFARVWSLTDLLAGPVETLCVLDPALTSLGWDALAGTLREAFENRGLLTILTRGADPPPVSSRSDGKVYSFIGPARLLEDRSADGVLDTLCFRVLRALFTGKTRPGDALSGVVVRQCPPPADALPPWRPAPSAPGPNGTTVVVLPHRGSPHHLRTALDSLARANPAPEAIRVGLDVDDPTEYLAMVAAYPQVEFFACTPTPAGPYVIRQALADTADEAVLAFQDSDDLSCQDRFHWLHAELARWGGGLVGSHELRFDEEDGEVRAIRFPLDAAAALGVEARHPLLHPTSAVPLADFRRAGGFSTDCVFGNDTQFLLRAYFHMPLRNVDRFLYLRRDRPDSLTNSPETGMKSPVRAMRNQAWRADFAAIKGGRLRLEGSTLMPVAGSGQWRLRPLQLPAAGDR